MHYFWDIANEILQHSVNICFVDNVLGMIPPGLMLPYPLFYHGFYSLLQYV